MTEGMVRWSLWLACPFNLLAAVVLAFPSSPVGQQFGLPQSVSPLYLWLLTLFLALFGFTYAWLARQPAIDRPMLGLGASGKLGAFVVALMLWFKAAVPGVVVLVALGDLAFAALWFAWLQSTRGHHAA